MPERETNQRPAEEITLGELFEMLTPEIGSVSMTTGTRVTDPNTGEVIQEETTERLVIVAHGAAAEQLRALYEAQG